jgi:hypothetical protein
MKYTYFTHAFLAILCDSMADIYCKHNGLLAVITLVSPKLLYPEFAEYSLYQKTF